MTKKIISCFLVLIMALGVFTICPLNIATAASDTVFNTPIDNGFSVETDKDYYLTGETVKVTAVGKSVNDSVAIRKKGTTEILYSYKLDSANNNAEVSLPTSSYGAGTYEIYIVPNDLLTTIYGKIVAYKYITISDNLAPTKSVYSANEPIMVAARGTVADGAWFGIRPVSGATMSMYFIDLNDSNNGTTMNIENGISQSGFDGFYDIPVGLYEVYFVPKNGYYADKTISYFITVTSDGKVDGIDITYNLKGESDGLADGTLSISIDNTNLGEGFSAYWVDENGRPLSDYASLAPFKITGTTTVRAMSDNSIIPQDARGLKIFTLYGTTELPYHGTVYFPEEYAFDDPGTPLYTFPVISDTHAEYLPNNDFYGTYNWPLTRALTDIKKFCPSANGVFINGDVTNNGIENEYKELQKILTNVYGSGSEPPVFIANGNHDCWGNSPTQAQELFIKYAGTLQTKVAVDKVYYDYWLGTDYHFIFLGDEDTSPNFTVNKGLNAIISDTQFTFLDNELQESRNKGARTFVFLHQSLYETVSGTYSDNPWNGIGTSGDDSNDAIANKFRSIMDKHCSEGDSDIFLFGAHTHCSLDFANNYRPATDKLPHNFNTAGIANTKSDYYNNKVTYFNSQGYILEVYEDKVVLKGRNFRDSKWMPSANYCIYDDEGHTITSNLTRGSGDIEVVTDSASGKFASGQQVSVKITPAAGYRITSIDVNGSRLYVENAGAEHTYTFTMPSAAVTLNVEFGLISSSMASSVDILYPDTYSVFGTDIEESTSEYLTDANGNKHYYAKFVNAIPTYSAHRENLQSYANMQVNGFRDNSYIPHITYYLYASKEGTYNVQLSYGIGSNNNVRYPISEEPYFYIMEVNGKIIKGENKLNPGYFNDVNALDLKTGINEVNIIFIVPETYSNCHRWVNVTKLTVPSNVIGILKSSLSTKEYGTANVTSYNKMILNSDGKIGMQGDGATFAKNNSATFENLTFSTLASKTPYFTMEVDVPYSGYYNLKMDFNIGKKENRGHFVMFVDGDNKSKVSFFSDGSAWYNKVKLPSTYLTKGKHTITLTTAYNCGYSYPTHNGYSTWTDFNKLRVLTPNFSGNTYNFGDCNDNGTVNADDLALLKRMLLETDTTTLRGETLSDTNGDGQIGLTDLLRLTSYLADSSVAIGPR